MILIKHLVPCIISAELHCLVCCVLTVTVAVSETEVIEAVAQYDFTGRTERELSFKKGDILVVFNQVSSDWWEGAFNGREGLIPDKYIQLRQR